MTVLVLAKSPSPGRSKTRLQSRWTPTQAAALAEASLADTLATVAGSGLPFEVVLDGDPGPWLPTGSTVRSQVNGSHAERIHAALRGARGPALLIGMDTPQVTGALLHVGLGALTRHEASLGLARDGGWWALGLRDPARGARLVLTVPTSTPHTGGPTTASTSPGGPTSPASPSKPTPAGPPSARQNAPRCTYGFPLFPTIEPSRKLPV